MKRDSITLVLCRPGKLLPAAAALLSLLIMAAGLLAMVSPEAALAAKTKKRISYAATIRDGRAAARLLLKQTGAASLSLALMHKGRIVWRQSFGYADIATKTRPKATTMYGIGSCSKMLATVAAMKLVDRGLVSLDAPLTRYIPQFRMVSPGYREVTVRMLLAHSSGFPGTDYRCAEGTSYHPDYLDQVLQTLAISRLKTTPGLMNVYCNDGFTVIEELVRSVTGKSYAQFVHDEILTPLNMRHTAYPLQPFADGSYAKCYGDGSVTPNPMDVVSTLGSGGAYSTPTDMSRLAAMLMNGGVFRGRRILKKASVAEMGRDQTARSFLPVVSNATRYGLGWDTVTDATLRRVGVRCWVKGGDCNDYHAGFLVAPKEKLAVIVTGVSPLVSGSLEQLGERIMLRALVDRGRLRRMPKRIAQKAPKPKKATAAQLAAVTGYWGMSGVITRVRTAGTNPQRLAVETLLGDTWSPPMIVRMRKDGRFHAAGNADWLRVVRAGGRDYLVMNKVGTYRYSRTDLCIGQKMEPGDALTAAWRGRVGRQWLVANDAADSITYSSDGGPLSTLLDIPGLPGYVTMSSTMQPVDAGVSDTTASMFLQIPGFGSRDMNDLVVEERGGEEWLRMGSTLLRPRASVPVLAAGANAVPFAAGLAEWRTVPTAGDMTITGASAWHLYDADLNVVDSGTTFPATVAVPSAGCSLLLHGQAGTSATVTR